MPLTSAWGVTAPVDASDALNCSASVDTFDGVMAVSAALSPLRPEYAPNCTQSQPPASRPTARTARQAPIVRFENRPIVAPPPLSFKRFNDGTELRRPPLGGATRLLALICA
jgi:hypothetical protein